MRAWIDLTEKDDLRDVHPHLRGEEEWFSFLWGSFQLNIDQCRRGIADRSIKAELHDVKPIQFGPLLGLDEAEFGSNDFKDEFKAHTINMGAAATNRTHMTGLPEEKLFEPAIIVMWKSLDGMKRAGYKIDKNAGEDKPAPWIVDGNHRLSRLFLEGHEEPVKVYVVPHEEALKFCYDRYRKPIIR